MTFVSYGYFTFLFLLLILYYALPHHFRWCLLLAASLLFCASLNVYSTIWLITTIAVSYFASAGISSFLKNKKEKTAKSILVLSLLAAYGSLFLIKYLPLSVPLLEAGVSKLTGSAWDASWLSIAMPVGISFYLFQVTGYLIDVYRQKTAPIRHFGHYALSVAFFAKLTQGPIAPVAQLVPQFSHKVDIDPLLMRKGALRILIGLFRKVVIADRLAIITDHIFAHSPEANASTVVIGVIFYAFQLYTDFSGYTDIAIGSAQLFGIDLPENFRQPYLASSIADFWRRWHLTLSSWLRTYVYFPLGGSRVSQSRWALNVLIVFLVSGMWHGSGINFIIWGILHGVYQIIGKFTAGPRSALKGKFIKPDTWLSNSISVVSTFILVCIAWVFFRAPSIDIALEMFSRLYEGSWAFSLTQLGVEANEWYLSLILILVTVLWDSLAERVSIPDWIENRALPIRWSIYLVLLFVLILFGMYGSLSAQSFIYVSF